MKWILCLCFAFAASVSMASGSFEKSASSLSDWETRRAFFKENGYLWIKDFFSDEQVRLLQEWAEEFNASAQDLLQLSKSSGCSLQFLIKHLPGNLIVVPEARDPNIVCRAEDLSSCYPGMFSFVSGTATEYIGRLLGEPYVLYKDKINFKWPGGGAFLPHQDYPAYELLGAREHVTAMISIDPATLENGCLHVAKQWKEAFAGDFDPAILAAGRAVLPYVTGGTAHGSIRPEYCDKIEWIPLETSPRDLVIFDSFIPHYSEPNQSNHSRRAMFFTHNRLAEGNFRSAYYRAKREDPDNPIFHIGTPTKARTKD
jgi:ectoine hydroxylase-related dioxygenase (phytanoyl-CoA dioxygenase family)